MTNESSFRARPHSNKLWLSIYKPKTILACQINDAAIDVGEDDITYNNITTGSYSNVRSGMTVYVGSSPGTWNYGRLRVRYASSTGTLRVAENSEIDWQNDLYLTVVDFYEIWSMFPNYAMNGEDVIFYKDFDTEYANQNSNAGMGTFIQMGPHYAGFAPASVYYSAINTRSPSNSLPLTYSWFFDGGTPTGSTNVTPGFVTYNTPGHYTTRLTVTTNDGAQDTSYRHVSIYTPPGGTNPPILSWEFTNLKGSRQEGGYTATIRIHEISTDVVDGALVVIFSDPDYYGQTLETYGIGGNATNRGKTVFVGYILNGSIRYNYQASYVEFDVGSSSEIMKQQPGLSVSVDSVESPTTWYELQDTDIAKIVYHYFRWHSTLLNTNDIVVTGSNYKFQYFDSEASTLYDAMQSFLQSSLLGYMICDIQNTMYIEDGPETIDYATLGLEYNLLRQDWIDEPEIFEKSTREVSYLELSGVAWAGSATGTWAEYISASPGNSLAYYGSLEQQTGLILVSQQMLNVLTGRVFAYRNARFPEITTRLAGSYRSFDIAPLKKYQMTVLPGDTVRGINFINKPMHISEISWEYDPENQVFIPEVMFHEFTDSYPGVTIIKPQTPIVNPPVQPPILLPPFPIVPIPTPAPIPPPTVPVPPEEVGCIGEPNPPANGPHEIFRGVLTSAVPHSWYVPFTFYPRTSDQSPRSIICFDGTWERSLDNGVTWITWESASPELDIEYMLEGNIRYPIFETTNPWDEGGQRDEARCAILPYPGGKVVGFVFGVVGVTGIDSTPYYIRYTGVDEGNFMGDNAWFTWQAEYWRGTAHWDGPAMGFPTYQRHMLLDISADYLHTGSFTVMVGCRPDNAWNGLPRYDYTYSSVARLARMQDPGGTFGGNPSWEGITGTYDGEWLYWRGEYDPNPVNSGTVYLGHFYGFEGRNPSSAPWVRDWELAILSINDLTPLGSIYKFDGVVSIYNIC